MTTPQGLINAVLFGLTLGTFTGLIMVAYKLRDLIKSQHITKKQ